VFFLIVVLLLFCVAFVLCCFCVLRQTQSLALFHLSNTELGVQDTELGARSGQQILSYNEFISCLRGVAMGEGFRTLPTIKEKVIALGSFLRRQAYTFGPLKHGKTKDRFKVDTGSLKTRMGDCVVWEKRAPLIEYVYMVPPSLNLPDSLRICLEIVDLICSKAPLHMHTLTLCPVTLEESEEVEEEAWAPPEGKPVDPDVLERLFGDPTKNQKPPKPPAKKTSGFGGSYVKPPDKNPNEKKRKKGKRRFGETTIGRLPLRHVHAAKACIAILAEIADSCVSGKGRARLEQVWELDGRTGGEAIQNSRRKKGMGKRAFVGLQKKKQKKLPPRKNLHPKETEKADVRRERDKMVAMRKQEKDQLRRMKRQQELKLIIEEQKKAKKAKLNADKRAKSESEEKSKGDREAKKNKKKEEDKKRRIEIQKWREDKQAAEVAAKNTGKTKPKKRTRYVAKKNHIEQDRK
jgi:hypothetical protein